MWGEASPHGFFESFPGAFGQHWVRSAGVYDEHLVRDFAAAELGFAVLLVAATLWFERRVVLAAGSAFLVFTLAHFAFHLSDTGALSTTANLLNLAGFLVEMLVVAAVMASVFRRPGSPFHEGSSHGTPATRQAART